MMVLVIIGYFLLFLLIALLLTLIVPVDYAIKASRYELMTLQGRIGWFWGFLKLDFSIESTNSKILHVKLLGFSFSINLGEENKTRKKKEKKTKKQKIPAKKTNGKFPLTREHFTKELFDVLLITIKRIFVRMKPEKLTFRCIYGFEDPYYTGIILTVTSSLYPMFNVYPIVLTPSFDEAKLEGEGEIQGRIIAVLFLFIILQLVLSKPIRSIIKTLFNKKKEEKKYVS